MTYTCAKCNAPAKVVNGTITRTCGCNAAIIAHMKAHATGEGGVK